MTVQSFVQQGHQNTGLIDAGPYSADQWALWLSSFNVPGLTLGAIRAGYLNELLVVNTAAQTFTVDTGAAQVNGRPTHMDALLTFNSVIPTVNPRVDIVGLCLNNTAISRTAGIASGNAFTFPTDLTDYEATASIPPFTARPVILTGTEAASPAAPILDTDPSTLFMIPLYQYKISTGGVISVFDQVRYDLRHYASLSPSTLIYRWNLPAPGQIAGMNYVPPTNFRHLEIVFEAEDIAGVPIPQFAFDLANGGAGATDYKTQKTTKTTVSTTVTAVDSNIVDVIASGISFDSFYGRIMIYNYNKTSPIVIDSNIVFWTKPAGGGAALTEITTKTIYNPAVASPIVSLGATIGVADVFNVSIYGHH